MNPYCVTTGFLVGFDPVLRFGLLIFGGLMVGFLMAIYLYVSALRMNPCLVTGG
jgi:hypothetical protein